MNVFLKGTLVLVLTAFLGECIEFVVNMVLAQELGEAGLGIYMSIIPVVFLFVIVASLELPISISKYIAEKDETFHKNMLEHVFRFAIKTTIVILIVSLGIFLFTPFLHEYHLGIRWLFLLLIPIVSFSSIFRGYFMGKHNMAKIAVSNFLRKVLQLLLLVMVYTIFSFDTETSIFIALCTLIGSEAVVFLYLLHGYVLDKDRRKNIQHQRISKRNVNKALLSVSVPTTVLRIFHALTHAIQPFLIKAALLNSGMELTTANEHFGLLAGVAITIGFFPAFIAHSLLIVLIPQVSERASNKDWAGLLSLLKQVIVITVAYGVPAVAIFYLFGDRLTAMFTDSSFASFYLKLLWPYFLFHFFVMPLQAFLIGLGLIKDALLHQIWSSVLSFALIYFLGSHPSFGMDGVIIGLNLGAVLITLLHFSTVFRELGIRPGTIRDVRHS